MASLAYLSIFSINYTNKNILEKQNTKEKDRKKFPAMQTMYTYMNILQNLIKKSLVRSSLSIIRNLLWCSFFTITPDQPPHKQSPHFVGNNCPLSSLIQRVLHNCRTSPTISGWGWCWLVKQDIWIHSQTTCDRAIRCCWPQTDLLGRHLPYLSSRPFLKFLNSRPHQLWNTLGF